MTETDNLPRWGGRPGGFETWHLTLTEPVSGQGVWIRAGLVAPRKGRPWGTAAVAAFHPANPERTFGIRERHSGEGFTLGGPDRYLRTGDVEVGPGFVRGTVGGGGRDARFDLTFPTGGSTNQLLPHMATKGPLGAAALTAPNAHVPVSGVVAIDGEELALDRVPGSQSHAYGPRRPERWAWARCASFEDEDAVFEAFTGQVRRGPYLTPFLTTVALRRQGRWLRFTRLRPRRDFSLGYWHIDVADRRFRLTGRVEAPAFALVRTRLEDPDGTDRHTHHTAMASCRLALFERRPGGFDEVAVLESHGLAHAEWAGRTPATAVERSAVEREVTRA
jgi:Tocopherol cyclase